MDFRGLGRIARRLEPLHDMIYFAPEAEARYVVAGLEPGLIGYFAGRCAAMGAAPAALVAATFYSFNPHAIAPFIPKAWTQASPGDLVAARTEAAGLALRRLLGQDAVASREMAEAAALARRAAEAISTEGRPLGAAHLAQEWPQEPHAVLWNALTVLREHRGDGHVAVLVNAGLSGIEAHITHTATGNGFFPEFAPVGRGWSPEEWQGGIKALRERGLLEQSEELVLTPQGGRLRDFVEDETHRLGSGPWEFLGAQGATRLFELAAPLADAALAAGAHPEGIFVRGY
jgi:hypothetical protein